MKQKNFKEIYDVIYSNVGKEIEKKRKKKFTDIILAIIILIIYIIVLNYTLVNYIMIQSNSYYSGLYILILTILPISIFVYRLVKIDKNYKLSYKEQIINEIVKRSNSNFQYSYYNGISSKDYLDSGFEYGWDRYNTEDRIMGELENGVLLKMAQVHTQERHTTTDSDGHTTTTYVTRFLGLFGIIELKTNTNANFSIMNNSKLAKFKKNRIEMESSEFEKYYDVYSGSVNTDNRQNAMELLTPEAIEQFVHIRNLFKKPINIRIYNNIIYFRIEVGDIFEPPTFKNSMNFDLLYKYFLIIDVPRMIYEAFIDNILVMYGDRKSREKRIISNMTDEERKEYEKNKKDEEESSYFSHK